VRRPIEWGRSWSKRIGVDAALDRHMDISSRHWHPQQQLAGFTVVVLFHAFVVYALTTGLARRVIDVVHVPIEAKVIAEIAKPAPPVEIVLPPPRMQAPPPRSFIPPPEVRIAAPAPQNTITVVTMTPPAAPVAITPVAPPAVTLPTAPTAAVSRPAPPLTAAVVCSNYAKVMGDAAYPREAQREGIDKGDALIEFTVGAGGQTKNIKVVHASHPIFGRNSVRIVSEYRCQGQGRDVTVLVPFGYKLD